ncbi:MAG: hypothetical protein JNL67_12055 [Planctomycetaceae bacterium]|nr:hypothetical protein [Planctomycetaceae bacterium]
MTTELPNPSNSCHRPVVGILWREARESPLYAPWIDQVANHVEVRVIADYEVEQPISSEVDLLVTHNHYRWDELAILRRTMIERDRGVLVLADGIAEYRNSWQNPTIPAGSLMQPAMAHKIATIGRAQSRLWESWGNVGRCETVGLPRLDAQTRRFGWWDEADHVAGSTRSASLGSNSTLLICSARTPAFSESQWEAVLAQFSGLHQFLLQNPPQVETRRVTIRWRVAERIREHLRLEPAECSIGELATEIEQANAVITTPSTLQLEASLAHRPTAVLNFSNLPLYVPAAWQISAISQVASVLDELFNPSAERLQYQQQNLREQLYCHASAGERMVRLVVAMAQIAARHRQMKRPVQFPDQILPADDIRLRPACDWERLLPERRGWLEKTQVEQSTLWELTEVSAAVLRAREYSEERRQLHYLSEAHQKLADVHQQAVQAYETALDDKRRVIDHLQTTLSELQERQLQMKVQLERRNSECELLQQRAAELAAGKAKAHEQLIEANTEGKRKQERINELRTHYHQIRDAYTTLKSKWDELHKPKS